MAVGGKEVFPGIVESESLFRVHGVFTLDRIVAYYTNLALLLPFAWIALLADTVRRKRIREPASLLLVVYTGFGLVLLPLQQRLGEFCAPAVAMLFGHALVRAGGIIAAIGRNSGQGKKAIALAGALITVVSLATLPSILGGMNHLASADQTARNRILVDFGKKLAGIVEGGTDRGDSGILCSDEDGVVLLYSMRKPVVVSSFNGTACIRKHNAKGFAALLAESERDAVRKMSELRSRLVVVSSLATRIEHIARLAGIKGPMVEKRKSFTDGKMVYGFIPMRRFIRSLHARMLAMDGSEGDFLGERVEALRRFRMLLESGPRPPQPYPVGPYFKAFELVEGARITGRAAPGSVVRLRLGLVTNTGRRFTYRDTVQAGGDGRFVFVVPYPTGTTHYPVHATTPYRIKIGGKVYHLEVPESAVVKGGEVPLSNSFEVIDLPEGH
ncbi:MAG: hypothetical protein D6806_00955 [Deltaproteobacteria bacterium]|nr:MAG: hypothetical protein D6806_00955 [Deltaproteobacteria bacterium]